MVWSTEPTKHSLKRCGFTPFYSLFSQFILFLSGGTSPRQRNLAEIWANNHHSGYESLGRPPRSHDHDSRAKNGALYRAPNGEKFGFRETDSLCPFPFVSAERGWSHLPDIGDGHV